MWTKDEAQIIRNIAEKVASIDTKVEKHLSTAENIQLGLAKDIDVHERLLRGSTGKNGVIGDLAIVKGLLDDLQETFNNLKIYFLYPVAVGLILALVTGLVTLIWFVLKWAATK